MQKVIEIITNAFQENLEAVFLLIVTTGILTLINIVLGTILGTREVGFSGGKFLHGFVKGLIVSLCIFAFCYTLNLLSLTLGLVDINISIEVITVLEVVMVMAVWDIDLAKEIFEKVKSLKTLKYFSYEDVNDYDVDRG